MRGSPLLKWTALFGGAHNVLRASQKFLSLVSAGGTAGECPLFLPPTAILTTVSWAIGGLTIRSISRRAFDPVAPTMKGRIGGLATL